MVRPVGGELDSLGNDGFVAKYDASGNLLWAQKYGGGTNSDSARRVVASSDGVFLVGQFADSMNLGLPSGPLVATSSSVDVFVARIDPTTGNAIWANRIGDARAESVADAVARPGGGVMISLLLRDNALHLAAYDAAGTAVGPNPATVVVPSKAEGGALAIVADGIWLAGSENGAGFVMKLALDGTTVLRRTAANAMVGIKPLELALDSQGNPVVAGTFTGTATLSPSISPMVLQSRGGSDVFAAKFAASNLALQWAKTGGSQGNDLLNSRIGLAIDANDNVVLGGSTRGLAGQGFQLSERGRNVSLAQVGTSENSAGFIARLARDGSFALPAAAPVVTGISLANIHQFALRHGKTIDTAAGSGNVTLTEGTTKAFALAINDALRPLAGNLNREYQIEKWDGQANGGAGAWVVAFPLTALGAANGFRHPFNEGGLFRVVARVTDTTGTVWSEAVIVQVTNELPAVRGNAPAIPTSVVEGTQIPFSGPDIFTEPGDHITSYTWQLLDANDNPLEDAVSAKDYVFVRTTPGSYSLRATATDADGSTGFHTWNITVTDARAIVTLPPLAVAEGSALQLDAHQHFTPSAGDTYRYRWEVRSGGPSGPVVAVSNARFLAFTSPDNGVYAVSLWVRDEEGNPSNTASSTLTVSNAVPVVAITGPSAGVEGSAVTFHGRRGTDVTDPGFADVDSLALAWRVTRSGQTITTGSGEDFSFTPADNGSYLVRLTATDKDGGTAFTERTITVANANPSVAVGPDANGTEGGTRAFSAVVTDAGSTENLVYHWQAILGGKAVATAATSTFQFTPSNNGLYTIRLTVTDKDGASGQDELAFTVGNQAPVVAFPSATVQTSEGQNLAWHAATLISDAAGDTLIKTWELFRVAGDGSRVAETTTTGESFTRLFPDNGTWVLRLTATDPEGATGTAELTIQVNNVAPVLTIAGPAQGVVGAQTTLTGTWTDVPADMATGSARLFINDIEQTARPPVFLSGNSFSVGLVPTEPGTYRVEITIRDNFGAAAVINHHLVVATGVVGRHLFYNNSAFDGRNGAANAGDDAALAPDKRALLPGQVATFANYSSYAKGINGIMIDVAGLANPAALSLADFGFRIGNSDNPASWSAAPAPTLGPVRAGAGLHGAHRITLVWPDGAIVGEWLEVRLKTTAVTGLAADDVFYFGNAPGDTGNDAGQLAVVDASDFSATASNPSGFLNPAEIDNPHDFNRDGRVNAFDIAISRNQATTPGTALRLIALVAPAPLALMPESGEAIVGDPAAPADPPAVVPTSAPPAGSPAPDRGFYPQIRFTTPGEQSPAAQLRELVARLAVDAGDGVEDEEAAPSLLEWADPSTLPVFKARDTAVDPLIFPAAPLPPAAPSGAAPESAPEPTVAKNPLAARSWERLTSLWRSLNL
jgi:hypothetical protein